MIDCCKMFQVLDGAGAITRTIQGMTDDKAVDSLTVSLRIMLESALEILPQDQAAEEDDD